MRDFSSLRDATRIGRRKVRAILERAPSIRFSQEPCFGVWTYSKRSVLNLDRVYRTMNYLDEPLIDRTRRQSMQAVAETPIFTRQADRLFSKSERTELSTIWLITRQQAMRFLARVVYASCVSQFGAVAREVVHGWSTSTAANTYRSTRFSSIRNPPRPI